MIWRRTKSAAIGTFVSMGNMSEVECLGYTGLDFVVIDTEHGPFDTETMMNLIRAAELVHLVPVVRLANVDHKDIQRAADCGAQAIILPCLRELDDFKKAVALAKYAPIGQRGFIKGRGTHFGNAPWAATETLEEYYANSNERLLVMPQCETKEALEQIEDIVQIEGLDGIFIGPYDLSTCLGIPGQFETPVFKVSHGSDPESLSRRRKALLYLYRYDQSGQRLYCSRLRRHRPQSRLQYPHRGL